MDSIKHRLADYLHLKNIEFKRGFYRCPNPSHNDENISNCKLYRNNDGDVLTCFVCGDNWDICDTAGLLIGSDDFLTQKKEVENTLGIIRTHDTLLKRDKVKQEKLKEIPVSIPIEKINEVYNDTEILHYANSKKYGNQITGKFPCVSKDGSMVEGIEYRFEGMGKKTVFLIYYSGKNLKWTNPPRLIFGLNEIKQGCPFLIVEGPKTREIASKALPDFNCLTWNGGANNADKVDWCSVIPDDAEVYLWPDDDTPGIEAMKKISEILPNVTKTIPIIPELRAIKPKGADIEQALIHFNNDSSLLKNYILGKHQKAESFDDLPDFFNRRCLGVSDDKQAYFIDASGRLESCRLKSLNKNILMQFCDISQWRMYYRAEKSERIDWDNAINDVMTASRLKDFDPDTTLGRGAWRRKDGQLCYHDGIDTYGHKDDKKHYLRKQKKDIGINDTPATVEICQEIGRMALEMTFETKLDAVRCLAWSCLAPFAGALPWRPAILLTGGSETGKTTIINKLVRTLGIPEFYNGAETTPAGLRSDLANDACGVVFDETEGGEKAQKNRQELFLVMRQSTSDDAPKVVKSNKDQATVKYNMNNMFMFSSIHAGIDDEADEKRILRVNLKKTDEHRKNWSNLKKRIDENMTEENCRGIRALTWKKLRDIIKYADDITDRVSEITGLSTRSAYAEALIISCYFLIWRGMEISECRDEIIDMMIADIYKHHEIEERNEPAETLNKLLDTIVYLPEKHENKTLREMLFLVKETGFESEKKEYMEALARYGLRYISDKEELLAVQKDNNMIKKILETGNGYNKILWRHKDCIDHSRRVRMAGSLRSCVMIKGLFETGEADK